MMQRSFQKITELTPDFLPLSYFPLACLFVFIASRVISEAQCQQYTATVSTGHFSFVFTSFFCSFVPFFHFIWQGRVNLRGEEEIAREREQEILADLLHLF